LVEKHEIDKSKPNNRGESDDTSQNVSSETMKLIESVIESNEELLQKLADYDTK